jgi:hypothetical protein
MLLWAAAEVPAVLSSAGVLVTSTYENLGLEVHLFSMFVFGGFVLVRGRNIFGEIRLKQMVDRVAYSTLSKLINAEGANALGFYVDYGLVSKDPKRFDMVLRKIFASGSDIIEKQIVDELYRTSGVPRDNGRQDFASAVSKVAAAVKKI